MYKEFSMNYRKFAVTFAFEGRFSKVDVPLWKYCLQILFLTGKSKNGNNTNAVFRTILSLCQKKWWEFNKETEENKKKVTLEAVSEKRAAL